MAVVVYSYSFSLILNKLKRTLLQSFTNDSLITRIAQK